MDKLRAQKRGLERGAETDVLFISESGLWPPDQGFRVHGCQMLKAMHEIGVKVRISSMRETDGGPEWLNELLVPWEKASENDYEQFMEGWSGRFAKLRGRVASHQAIEPRDFAGAIRLVKKYRPKAVVAVGLHGPIMLKGLEQAFPRLKRIWYAADEPVSFHVSCLRRDDRSVWRSRLRSIALFGLLETLFSRGLDGAIGVSPFDSKRLKQIGGVRECVTIRNGVDLKAYDAEPFEGEEKSLVFWGRMDFEPNTDAMIWFVKEVWHRVLEREPNAKLKIVGKFPTNQILDLGNVKGVEVTGEVADIKPFARGASVTVLPMRCGIGIKNKLLEAAAMGLAVIASPHAIRGLEIDKNEKPFCIANQKQAWVDEIISLWNNPAKHQKQRMAARKWVEKHHDWRDAAAKLTLFINEILEDGEEVKLLGENVERLHKQENKVHRRSLR